MQVKLVVRDDMKLLQAVFSEAPEVLDAVDVVCAAGRFFP